MKHQEIFELLRKEIDTVGVDFKDDKLSPYIVLDAGSLQKAAAFLQTNPDLDFKSLMSLTCVLRLPLMIMLLLRFMTCTLKMVRTGSILMSEDT